MQYNTINSPIAHLLLLNKRTSFHLLSLYNTKLSTFITYSIQFCICIISVPPFLIPIVHHSFPPFFDCLFLNSLLLQSFNSSFLLPLPPSLFPFSILNILSPESFHPSIIIQLISEL